MLIQEAERRMLFGGVPSSNIFDEFTKHSIPRKELSKELRQRLMQSDSEKDELDEEPLDDAENPDEEADPEDEVKYLTHEGLLKALEALCQDNGFIEEPSSARYLFYLQVMEEPYLLTTLRCMGILLGKDSVRRKALLFFRNYDDDDSGTIDSNEMETLMTDIRTIAVDFMPKLAGELFQSDKKTISNYTQERLNGVDIKRLNVKYTGLLLGQSTIKRDEFVSFMGAEHFAPFFSAGSFRKLYSGFRA